MAGTGGVTTVNTQLGNDTVTLQNTGAPTTVNLGAGADTVNVRATGAAELSTHDVGLAILGPLQDLDLVAYLRFASVYRAFGSLEDFEAAIVELREQRPPNDICGPDGDIDVLAPAHAAD